MEYFRRFTLWFLAGTGASLGIALVTFGYGKYTERERQMALEAWLPSSSVVVSDVEVIAIAKELTVAAVLTNNASENVIVALELALSQGPKIIFTCGRTAPSTPGPGRSMRIQVSCADIEKSAIPSGVTYSLKVKSVRPLP